MELQAGEGGDSLEWRGGGSHFYSPLRGRRRGLRGMQRDWVSIWVALLGFVWLSSAWCWLAPSVPVRNKPTANSLCQLSSVDQLSATYPSLLLLRPWPALASCAAFYEQPPRL